MADVCLPPRRHVSCRGCQGQTDIDLRLKVDSTKELAKKLAGDAARTAQWVTDVGNEHGQVMTCVLTTAEGARLQQMGRGLVHRYREAHVYPPKVLYIDRDCCGPAAGRIFRGWQDMQVRLDIWHMMRRFARGCTADSHQLYGVFMSRLSTCIFEWDTEAIANLCQATEENCDESAARRLLTRRELALHCRRRTRRAETTTNLIKQLIESLKGGNGLDMLGIPIFDQHSWTRSGQRRRNTFSASKIQTEFSCSSTMEHGGQAAWN